MANCEHCENLAIEIRETRSIVERLVAETAATRTVVEGMQKTLLGNGQPGRCAEHGIRIARLERWRSWIAGALAVLGVLWMAAVTIAAAVAVERFKR
ncbi:MAG TPA: hypothetical protein VE999_01595 [Gemmataceae bacterium]|nr:hypothetical protein [Gemmataceae bacterium]